MREHSIVALMRSGKTLRAQDGVVLGRAIARQLAAAHVQGVAHGDVGPHTVFVAVDEATDGGIVSATLGAPRPPMRPTTWPLAPEVSRGIIGPAADIFALGHLVRAWCTYAEASTAAPAAAGSPGSSTLPPVVTSMVELDPARRPTVARVLEALGSEGPGPGAG